MSTEGARNADERIPGASPLICHRCGALLKTGEGSFYVVRIEAYADPSPPDLDDATSMAIGVDDLLEVPHGRLAVVLLDRETRPLQVHTHAGKTAGLGGIEGLFRGIGFARLSRFESPLLPVSPVVRALGMGGTKDS